MSQPVRHGAVLLLVADGVQAQLGDADLVIDRHRGLVGNDPLDVVDGTERSEMDRSEATCPQGAVRGEH